ncbi:MAG: shikimate dehydrogenase [Limibacillus sp.]|jgi:shikimate dehydrogenase
MILTGKAKMAGVMGWPVGHSKSPRLHGWWLERYGIDGAYLPLPVKPDDLEASLRALPKLGFAGCNLTIPHKEAAMEICDRLDPLAERVGAVNTVIVEPDGSLLGSNSDAFGFIENLKAGAPDWRADSGPAVILGAGGAARALIVGLLDAGAPEIRLVNRSFHRAESLAEIFEPTVEALEWESRDEALAGAALLVNATSLGMTGQPALEIALDALPEDALVTDIVYSPLETPLLAASRARGNPAVDGLGMLLHQARPGFAAWFGREPEVTAELRAFVLGD